MEDGAEDLGPEVGDGGDADHGRGDELARGGDGDLVQEAPLGPCAGDMGRDRGGGGRVDHRADIGREMPGVAGGKLVHRAGEEMKQAVGDILLHEEAAQRRAALAGGAEGAGDDVAHGMFGQRGAVDDHRVQPPGFRDERGAGGGVGGEACADLVRGGGGAGEGDAVQLGPGGQRRAGGGAAGQELQRCAGHAGGVQHLGRAEGHERGLVGGLGQHRVAGDECGRDLAGEDREREVPGRDAGEEAAGRAVAARGLGGVVAQEIHRLAQFGDGVGQGLAGLAREECEEFGGGLFEKVGGVDEDRGARGHGGGPGAGGGDGGGDVGGGRGPDGAHGRAGGGGEDRLGRGL